MSSIPKYMRTLAICFGLLSVVPASAGPKLCSELFTERSAERSAESRDESSAALQDSDLMDWNQRREAVLAFLQAHPEVPSFMKQTEQGQVPVLLLNEVTFPVLAPLLDASVGYGFALSVPGGSDHAMLRIQRDLMDIGHMATRRGGEINNNGLKWLELKKTLPWRRVMIQNSYLMPKADRDIVSVYHLVRRASLFRTRYAFSHDHELDRITPNLLEEVAENCYRYCKSDQTPQMLAAIHSRLDRMIGGEWRKVIESQEAKSFVEKTRSLLLKTDPYNEAKLKWGLTKPLFKKSGVNEMLSSRLTDMQREAVANLIVSERAVADYVEVLKRYRVSNHHGYQDIDAGAVSFTIIMADMSEADRFRSGNFEASGAYFHWTKQGQAELSTSVPNQGQSSSLKMESADENRK